MASYYFYIDENRQQQGPIDLVKFLKTGTYCGSRPFTENTYVWKEGMADWMRAGEVTELRNLFYPTCEEQSVTAVNHLTSRHSRESAPNVYGPTSSRSFWEVTEELWWAILSFGLAALATWFLFWFFSGNHSGRIKAGVLIAPVLGVYYGFKHLISFFKNLFS